MERVSLVSAGLACVGYAGMGFAAISAIFTEQRLAAGCWIFALVAAGIADVFLHRIEFEKKKK